MNHYEMLMDNFKAISRIPRPSGQMEEISDFIYDFAVKNGVKARKDTAFNVVAFLNATKGYEDHDTVMLQGHMDLVAEKSETSNHDFSKDPIELIFEGDILHANQTTLGGDDGIAVATMMTLMQDKTIPHPALELVFTADEETGMFGAQDFDPTGLKATKMINLDNECEGEFLVSCAGGARFQATLNLKREQFHGTKYSLRLETQKGGHSGCEIHKNRPNALITLVKALSEVEKRAGSKNFRLVSIGGGKMDNAIPSLCTAVVVLKNDVELGDIDGLLKAPFEACDDHPTFTFEKGDEGEFTVLKSSIFDAITKAVLAVPNGVVAFSKDMEGLVESSMNLGVIKEKEENLLVRISVRSSVDEKKEKMLTELVNLFREAGYSETEISGDYPGWAYRKDSPLRDTMVKIYEDKYTALSGRKPRVEAIHAGLECGLLLQKMPGLDIVSVGADSCLIHTPKEYIKISSMNRMFDYLKDVLEAL